MSLLSKNLPWFHTPIADPRFRGISYKDKPLVLIFGWAGSSLRNLSKYADLYKEAGCLTLCYTLPSRFNLDRNGKVPYLTSKLLDEIKARNLHQHPVILHLLSDTGSLTHQGLDVSMRSVDSMLDIRGSVLDSCGRVIPTMSVNWMYNMYRVHLHCWLRDKVSKFQLISNLIR